MIRARLNPASHAEIQPKKVVGAVFAGAGTGARPAMQLPTELAPGFAGRMCRSLEQHPLAGFAED